MILLGLGILLVLAGIGLVVYQAGRNWSRPGDRSRKPDPGDAKPRMSYWIVLLVGLGAVLVAIGTSGSPPPH